MAVNNDPKFNFAQWVHDHPEFAERIYEHHKASSLFNDFERMRQREKAETYRRRTEFYWERKGAFYGEKERDNTIRDEAYRGKVLTDVTYRRA